MPGISQAEKAQSLLSLHRGPRILVLPNAWDVSSARIFEDAGFPAIATTSSGVANSLGYPDGQHISRNEMLEVVDRITHAVSIPVTADMEGGYGTTLDAMAETARGVIAAGAVGLNLEDSLEEGSGKLVEIPMQKEKIAAIVEVGKKAGVPLVVNARTDVYLEGIAAPSERLGLAVERLNAYRDAGASSLFAPGVKDAETITALVRAVHGPLNILATTGTPPVRDLEKLGVARVTVGGGPMRATMGLVSRIAKQLRDQGTYDLMLEYLMPYTEANRLMLKRRSKSS
jgi:2-methylisocitrate lyase-like PEP mutase family enzyme